MPPVNKDFVLTGPQGSGKGTQGRILSDSLARPFFEMGAYLRKIISENRKSPFVESIERHVSSGRLIHDDDVKNILELFIKQHSGEGIVFDGICRTLDQAKIFDGLMKKLGREYIVININLPKELAYDRVSVRRICPKCKATYPISYKKNTCSYIYESGLKCDGILVKRQDDKDEKSINERLDNFYGKTSLAIDWLRENGNLIDIDGNQDIMVVTREINSKIYG